MNNFKKLIKIFNLPLFQIQKITYRKIRRHIIIDNLKLNLMIYSHCVKSILDIRLEIFIVTDYLFNLKINSNLNLDLFSKLEENLKNQSPNKCSNPGKFYRLHHEQLFFLKQAVYYSVHHLFAYHLVEFVEPYRQAGPNE
ncbi:hypothetical protein BpHYR1_031968 [Brachionus plicatilis]|uniref:Uncharacterized protein n=1 Tax=Brachionus plicatilis TaxID=10195 RepID=A0A3M7SP47_BRAPC|nr:hypothetical protein BpHYR1_031968 [Brachionus plicatilis]